MAKQVGSYRITGTIDDICFYIREGEYLARSKSSLDRKRYKSDPVFEGSRRSNDRMAKASPIASRLYKLMDKEQKGGSGFNKLVGQIQRKIREGWDESKVEIWFREEYLGEVRVKSEVKVKVEGVRCFANYNIQSLCIFRVFKNRNRRMFRNRSPGRCGVIEKFID